MAILYPTCIDGGPCNAVCLFLRTVGGRERQEHERFTNGYDDYCYYDYDYLFLHLLLRSGLVSGVWVGTGKETLRVWLSCFAVLFGCFLARMPTTAMSWNEMKSTGKVRD